MVPSLLVRDLAESLSFYELLGFHLSGRNPTSGAPRWAEVRRDRVILQLYTEPPTGTPSEPILSGTLYMYPEDVNALARELEGRIEFAWGPQDMDYGMREFAVRDPNGYYLAFTQPLESR